MNARRVVSLVAAFAALTLQFTVAPEAWAQSAKKKPKKSVGQLRKSLSSVQKQKRQIASQIRKTKRAANAVMSDIKTVDTKLGSLAQSLEVTGNRLAANKKEQASLAVELRESIAKLDDTRRRAAKRLRQIYMQSEESPVLALIGAKDLGELAARKSIYERIAGQDKDLFEDLRQQKRAVAARKARQDELVAETARLMGQQRQEQGELKAAKGQKQSLLGELRSQQKDLEAEYAQLDRESDAIAAQIRAYQSAQRASGKALPRFSGRFLRPVNGPITSGYGYRFHPILKRRKLHTGIDFGVPSGTPIRAAAGGIVIAASYRRGYGNTVMIDHGGGISTLYGHCSRLFVSAGQKVAAGERIAAVGSTGLSTGPHLHWEVRVDGSPVNPAGR